MPIPPAGGSPVRALALVREAEPAPGAVEGIRVDGAPVSAYSKAPGSIILTLHPAYLDSLSVGYHTLAVYFTDGEATADFLILPAGGSYYNNSTSERYTYVPPSNVPRTGDESNIALWGGMAAVSLAGALLIIRRKKA